MTAEGSAPPTGDGGTPEEEWERWPGLDRLPPLELDGVREAVVVAPHPDDETLGFGGGIAVLASRGVRLRVVAVTDGESSHPGSTVFTGDELALRRADERARALSALGAGSAEVVRLRMPDGGVSGRESELARRLAELAGGADLCVAPWEGDPHPDHEAVGRAARLCARGLGVRLVSYPVWTWHWTRPTSPGTPWDRAARLTLSGEVRGRKAAALRAFATQTAPIGPGAEDGTILAPSMLAHFTRDHEVVFT